MTRLLYISPGPVPPGEDTSRDEFTYLSEIAEGDVLLPIWLDSQDCVPPYLRNTFPIYRAGNFRYHLFLANRPPKFLRWLAIFVFYIRHGLQLHKERKFDVIYAWGTNRPGVAAMVLKWLTGAKMIVEVPAAPEHAFRYEGPNPSFLTAIKRFFADRVLNFVGSSADCIKLLYPWQLNKYPKLANKKVAVFHCFVPVRAVRREIPNELFVLSAGYPWYRKGMDVLIRAFRMIGPRFPEYKLKLLGHFPDREFLDALAAESQQIEFLAARPNPETLKIISACSVYVLASRNEGLPRVLQEAMAAGKPIIASAVAGVPYCITDNVNGLLFKSEDIEDLASKLKILLSDSTLRARLADAGYERVMSDFDERAYVRSFQQMLDSVLKEVQDSDRMESPCSAV